MEVGAILKFLSTEGPGKECQLVKGTMILTVVRCQVYFSAACAEACIILASVWLTV